MEKTEVLYDNHNNDNLINRINNTYSIEKWFNHNNDNYIKDDYHAEKGNHDELEEYFDYCRKKDIDPREYDLEVISKYVNMKTYIFNFFESNRRVWTYFY